MKRYRKFIIFLAVYLPLCAAYYYFMVVRYPDFILINMPTPYR